MDVIVCKSAAGYYIGTLTEEGWPNSRESVEYYHTREEAQKALDEESYTQRQHY
jgi:hypothetical protein